MFAIAARLLAAKLSLRVPHPGARVHGVFGLRAWGLWPFLVLLSLAGLLAPRAQAGMLWGVNGHPFTAYPGISAAEQIETLADAGLRSYRVDVSSLDQMDQLANLIRVAQIRNVQILPVLIPPADLKAQPEDVLYRDAFEFAKQYLVRFGSDIPVWELGNEMENFAIIQPCELRDDGTIYPCEWGPAGGVGKLEYFGLRYQKVAAVLRGLSEGARAGNPVARRAIGTAGWGHIGFFSRLRDSGIAWDISVWHLYGQDPEWAFNKLAEFQKPIWVTEFNYPLGSSKDGEDKQAAGLQTIMARLRELSQRYRVEAAFIYELLDEAYWAPSYEASMGLVHSKPESGNQWSLGARKSAFQTVRRSVVLLGDGLPLP